MADLILREKPITSLVSLAPRRGQTLPGLTLPDCGHWTTQNDLTLICTTPNQYLVMQDAEGLFDHLTALLGDTATLIELSHSRIAVTITGPDARDRLATFLPLDLHPRALRPGMAAATIAAHLAVTLRQIDDTPTYELHCPRSFATSFRRALALADIR